METLTSMIWLLLLLQPLGTLASNKQPHQHRRCTILHMENADGWLFSFGEAPLIRGWVRHEDEDPGFIVDFEGSLPLEVSLASPGTWHEINIHQPYESGHHEVRIPSLDIALLSSNESQPLWEVRVTSSKLVMWSFCEPEFFLGTTAGEGMASTDERNNYFLLILILLIVATIVALLASVCAVIEHHRYKQLVK